MPDAAIQAAKRRQSWGIGLVLVGLALGTHGFYRIIRRDAIAFRAAESAYARQEYAAASFHYAKARSAGYDSLLMARHHAQALLETGQADAALSLLRPWLLEADVPADLLDLAIGATQRLGLPQDGLTLFSRLGPREQLSPSNLVRLADLHQQAGQWDEAVICVQLAVARVPDSAELHALTGHYLAGAGRRPEAIAALSSALQLAPTHRAAQLALARTLAWDQRYPEAVFAYRIYLGE